MDPIIEIKLKDTRKAIDQIDKELISLLARRSNLALEAKNIKGDMKHKAYFVREMTMIHNILSQDIGYYNPNHIAHIWRQIIMSTLLVEGSFSVNIIQNNRDNADIINLTRDFFGPFVQYKIFTDTISAIKDVSQGRSYITMVSKKELGSNGEPWWLNLKDHNAYIFCLLPMLKGSQVERSQFQCYGITNHILSKGDYQSTDLMLCTDQQLHKLQPRVRCKVLDSFEGYNFISSHSNDNCGAYDNDAAQLIGRLITGP